MPAQIASRSEVARRSSPDRGDGLFDFPLPIPGDTVYEELAIAPESPDAEIAWAIKEANDRREAERSQLIARIKRVFAEVQGLERAYEDIAALRSQSGASTDDLCHLQERVSQLEKQATAADPGFHEARQRANELAQETDRINGLKLDQPVAREAYNQEHPPIALLKVSAAVRDSFIDSPRLLLTLLRREMTAFLQERGELVYHASDLDRQDFTADFTHTSLLDDME